MAVTGVQLPYATIGATIVRQRKHACKTRTHQCTSCRWLDLFEAVVGAPDCGQPGRKQRLWSREGTSSAGTRPDVVAMRRLCEMLDVALLCMAFEFEIPR